MEGSQTTGTCKCTEQWEERRTALDDTSAARQIDVADHDQQGDGQERPAHKVSDRDREEASEWPAQRKKGEWAKDVADQTTDDIVGNTAKHFIDLRRTTVGTAVTARAEGVND